MFEGSMYMFAFFWAPALKSVQTSSGDLPFIYIFSCFMASALAASLTFNIVIKKQLLKLSTSLIIVLLVASFVFFQLSKATTEITRFALSCLVGAAFGMYWPCMGTLKGRLIEDGVRAKVYSAMRVPVNLFVVGSILYFKDTSDISKVFLSSSMLLSASFAAVWAASLQSNMP